MFKCGFSIFCCLAVMTAALLAGCSSRDARPLASGDEAKTAAAAPVARDPAGPIPAPTLPPHMAAPAAVAPVAEGDKANGLRYTVACAVREEGREKDELSAAEEAIVAAFTKSSLICRMAETPPDTLTGLEQRLSVSLKEARQVLESRGYYAGRVFGRLERAQQQDSGEKASEQPGILVKVVFIPGPQYHVGETRLREQRRQASKPLPGTGKYPDPTPPPADLSAFKLPKGTPAVADEVLAAVDRALEFYTHNGYPFAKIASTRFTVDHERRLLEADILVRPGPLVRMGEVERKGAPSVRPGFVKAMRLWEPGQPWNQTRIEDFQEALRGSGLFQSIEVKPADKADADGLRAVVASVESAPERTIGGALKYNSDFGPGLLAYWEHRNLTGRGDRLRVEMPLWADMQELSATYRQPFFLRNDQTLIARGGLLNQNLKAYNLQSGAVSGGIERRLSPQWSVSIQASAEGGSLKEPDKARRDYSMYGLPLGATYDSTDSLLNAARGARLFVSMVPYTGSYEGDFSVLRTRLDGHSFFSLKDEDTLILALRGAFGAVAGASASRIPPSARFYSGGGGSVRGYAFQSLGPRKDKKALGGGMLTEVSTELRWKLSEEWGLVGFVDGGTAIEDGLKNPDMDLRWGAGLGLRFYTAIGPIRFDLATPLTPRKDDDPLQMYISIGQSF